MKRSDNIAWSQIKVGIFIICALIFLAGGIILMGKQTNLFAPKGMVSIIMTDVAGLKVGAPVWLAGVDVGVVTRVRFESPRVSNEVEIGLEVDREALKKIGSDSVITIKTRGLMGEKYVDITPSKAYSEVPAKRLYGTQLPKLDDVMMKAGTTFDTLNNIIGRIDKGNGSINKLLNDPKLYDNLSNLTQELNIFVMQVNHGEGTLGKLSRSSESYDKLMSILNHTDETIKDIQNADGTLNKLIYDRKLYEKLVALSDKSIQAADDVRELNKKLNSRDNTIGKLLGDRDFYNKGVDLLEQADKSVKAFEEVADRVNRGDGTAGKLLNNQELYNRLSSMVDSVNNLVNDIKEHPKRYLKFSVF
jgi:phospholipid/cholesterol/gamma-HCH transport system substrate-binding protein